MEFLRVDRRVIQMKESVINVEMGMAGKAGSNRHLSQNTDQAGDAKVSFGCWNES